MTRKKVEASRMVSDLRRISTVNRLYGSPGDRTMRLADGRECRVESISTFTIEDDGDALDSKISAAMSKYKLSSELGFLPVQIGETPNYSVLVYRVIPILDHDI